MGIISAQQYHDLTTNEIASLGTKKIFLPVGSIEQHGPHLPLSVDVDIPVAIANELARRTSSIVAPSVHYGARSLPQSGGGSSFPGTISVTAESLIGYYRDIFRSYIEAGVSYIAIINGHYENEPFIFEALDQCRENGFLNAKVVALSWWSILSDIYIEDLFGNGNFPGWHAEHAGVVETSLMLYLHPEKVNAIRVDHDAPPLAGVYIHPIDPAAITNQGVLSKTSASSAEIGKILFDEICNELMKLLQKPHGMAAEIA